MVFNSRIGHNITENTKIIKILGIGGLHRFPDPVAGSRTPKPHLRSQHFGLPVSALGGRPRELRAPMLLLNQGLSEPCYATGTTYTQKEGITECTRSYAVVFCAIIACNTVQ